MVAVDYSYRDTRYGEWVLKYGADPSKVPADNLYQGYWFINRALSVVGSVWSAVKSDDSDDGDGAGGVGLGGSGSVPDDNNNGIEELNTRTSNNSRMTSLIDDFKKYRDRKDSEGQKKCKEIAQQLHDTYDNVEDSQLKSLYNKLYKSQVEDVLKDKNKANQPQSVVLNTNNNNNEASDYLQWTQQNGN